jgi:hypothetical protein
VKKLQTQVDKSNVKIETLETSLKTLEEKHASAEETLKVRTKYFFIKLAAVKLVALFE